MEIVRHVTQKYGTFTIQTENKKSKNYSELFLPAQRHVKWLNTAYGIASWPANVLPKQASVVQKLQISMNVVKCTVIYSPGKNNVNIYGSSTTKFVFYGKRGGCSLHTVRQP